MPAPKEIDKKTVNRFFIIILLCKRKTLMNNLIDIPHFWLLRLCIPLFAGFNPIISRYRMVKDITLTGMYQRLFENSSQSFFFMLQRPHRTQRQYKVRILPKKNMPFNIIALIISFILIVA